MLIETTLQILLSEHVSKAAYIIDKNGTVKSYNSAGENYLPQITENSNLFEMIEDEVSAIIKEIVKDADLGDETIKKEFGLNNTGVGDKFQLFCLPVNIQSQKLFIITLGKIQDNIARDGNKKFIFYTSEIESFITDEVLLNIINSIKTSYPFTFIGKSKFQKDIDKLDVAFWIKDQNGKFSIVNQRYAGTLGLRVSQIEGQYEKDLVPRYMLKLNKTIDNYILETSNSVVVERDNPSSLRGKKEKIELIEFPICDIDNNVVAIVGFSRTKSENEQAGNSGSGLFLNAIEEIDELCLIINNDDIIKAISKKLLWKRGLKNAEEVIDRSLSAIFGNELNDSLREFKNNQSQKELNIDRIKLRINNESGDISLQMKKVGDAGGTIPGILIIFKTTDEKITKDFSDKMYEAMMQNSPEAMFIYDIENLQFLEVNNAALKLYGFSREQFLNMDLTDLYAPEDIQTLLDSSNTRAMSGDFTGPWRHKKHDGESILVELSKTSLVYNSRKSHLNIVRDVGEKLEKEKSMKIFKASFDNSSDIIINTDMDGFITYMNEKGVKILGYSRKDIEGNSFLSILGDDYRAIVSTNIFHSDERNSVTKEIKLKKNSGDLIDALLIATPIFNYEGNIDSFNILLKHEERFAEKTKTDDHEPDEKQGFLEASFLSNVFHEILTPINVIVGFVRELTESIQNPTADQKEAADIINENQKLLLQLMDNAVEYSSLVQGKSTFKPEGILFTDLIDELKSSVKRTGEENNVEFAYGKISSSLKFESDRSKLLTLLTSFLKFSIQLTKQSKIYLSAYAFDDDKCVITVKDDRKEISKELSNGLKDILNGDENEIRRKYGFSRFTVKLTQKLLDVLQIKNELLVKGREPVEYALILPMELSIAESDKLTFESSFIDEAFREKPEEEVQKAVPEKVEEEVTAVEHQDTIDEKIEKLINKKMSRIQQATMVEETSAVVEEIKNKEPEIIHEIVINKNTPQENPSVNVNVNLNQQPTPEQKPPAIEETPVVKKGVNLSELSCLYVEDQVDSQILFKVQMKDMKSVEFATSFEKAVPYLKSKTFDFIVMDINLQGEYNGLDALRIIQKMPGYQKIPIIAVTAYVLPGDREKFIAAGFKDFISKPILRDKLLEVLKSIFG